MFDTDISSKNLAHSKEMLKLIDLTYCAEPQFDSLKSLLDRYKSTLGYADHINQRLDVSIIKHIAKPDKLAVNGVKFFAFVSKNMFAYIPLVTNRFVKYLNPDIVLIQGFTFPLQVVFLRLMLGNKPIFILQFHGGKPWSFPRIITQYLADKFVNAYLFTSIEMADEWIAKGVISGKNKCYELPEASTDFTTLDKSACKQKLGFIGDYNFLWVGRLNANKDPITVLNGFEKFLQENPTAKLYMIYQTNDLLEEIEQKISKSNVLKKSVKMVGRILHHELVYWYNAADFFVSASHHEGSGFALIESMACGCIPVVSHIAPFKKMLADGKFGCLFEKGNAEDLAEVLKDLYNINREKLSAAIVKHFCETMSHKAIADQLVNIVYKLKK